MLEIDFVENLYSVLVIFSQLHNENVCLSNLKHLKTEIYSCMMLTDL